MKKGVACVRPLQLECGDCGAVLTSKTLESHMASCPYASGYFNKSGIHPGAAMHPFAAGSQSYGLAAAQHAPLFTDYQPPLAAHAGAGAAKSGSGAGEMDWSGYGATAAAAAAGGAGKAYPCPQCDKQFASSSSLSRHKRSAHCPPEAQHQDFPMARSPKAARPRTKAEAMRGSPVGKGRLVTMAARRFPPPAAAQAQPAVAVATPMQFTSVPPRFPAPQPGVVKGTMRVESMRRPKAAVPPKVPEVQAQPAPQMASSLSSSASGGTAAAQPEFHQCAVCGIVFAEKKTLTAHRKTHAPPKQAAAPPKQTLAQPKQAAAVALLASSAAAAAAQKAAAAALVHVTGKTMECATCSGAFDTIADLKRHIKQAHGAAVRCGQCGKGYASIDTLQRHVAKQHGGSGSSLA